VTFVVVCGKKQNLEKIFKKKSAGKIQQPIAASDVWQKRLLAQLWPS
jgi:hypothetical protein